MHSILTHYLNSVVTLSYAHIYIKIIGSESQGQERAKQIAKNKMCDKLLCVFYTNEHFCNMISQHTKDKSNQWSSSSFPALSK